MKKRSIIIICLVLGVGLLSIIGGAMVIWQIYRALYSSGDEVNSTITCGGIAGLRCSAGYVCYYPENADYPDAAGECIPEYVDEGLSTNGNSSTDWPVYTNDTYGFSVQYPADWGVTEYATTETHFDALTGESIKFNVFDYSAAPVDKTALQANAKNINGTLVYFSTSYDQSGAVFIRQAEFFVGNDYVRFTMPVFDNILADGGFIVDPSDQTQLNEMITRIEHGTTESDATERLKIFDTMLLTLQVK